MSFFFNRIRTHGFGRIFYCSFPFLRANNYNRLFVKNDEWKLNILTVTWHHFRSVESRVNVYMCQFSRDLVRLAAFNKTLNRTGMDSHYETEMKFYLSHPYVYMLLHKNKMYRCLYPWGMRLAVINTDCVCIYWLSLRPGIIWEQTFASIAYDTNFDEENNYIEIRPTSGWDGFIYTWFQLTKTLITALEVQSTSSSLVVWNVLWTMRTTF